MNQQNNITKKLMANKQTAVDWLVNEITSVNTNLTFGEIVKQAKQMEEEQIRDAWLYGQDDGATTEPSQRVTYEKRNK